MDQPIPTTQSNPDEINLLEYIYALVKHKWLIIGFTQPGHLCGNIVSHITRLTGFAEKRCNHDVFCIHTASGFLNTIANTGIL
jgi:hypothetical protein